MAFLPLFLLALFFKASNVDLNLGLYTAAPSKTFLYIPIPLCTADTDKGCARLRSVLKEEQ
jgi:hypothetical protein